MEAFLSRGMARLNPSFQTAHDIIKMEELHSFEIPLEFLQSKRALSLESGI